MQRGPQSSGHVLGGSEPTGLGNPGPAGRQAVWCWLLSDRQTACLENPGGGSAASGR